MALNKVAVINISTALVSLVVALVLCEGLTRWIDGYALFRWDLFPVPAAERSEAVPRWLFEYAKRLPNPTGVNLRWFDEAPPLPVHRPDIKELDEVSNEAGADPVFPQLPVEWSADIIRDCRGARSAGGAAPA
jgi:hypothetical protein